jgi:ABC-type multidrug transport system permease subunit
MAKASLGDVVGGWAFLIGVLLAIVAGLFPAVETPAVMTALVVAGLIVGFLNVGDKEVTQFLFSGLVLVLISSAGAALLSNVPYVSGILTALLAIFIPATVVVAVKNVFSLAKR